jgi:predicted secreted protein
MKRLLLLFSLALAQTAAHATDANLFRSLGFSADGRYYAWAESVVQDGSGFPSAKVQVIDVAQNLLVKNARVVLQQDGATEAQALSQAKAHANVAGYGIDGKHAGRTLWMRMPTDMTAASKDAVFSLFYGVDGGSSSVGPKYDVNVSEQAANSGADCIGYPDNMISVQLTNLQDNTTVILQKDAKAPKSRQCSSEYQVRQVLENSGSIVTVLRYESLGFEGPDYHHMVVTGAKALPKSN